MVLLLQGLAACRTAPPAFESGGWRLQGKLAVMLPDGGGTARIDWLRQADGDVIRLRSPFGQMLAVLTGSDKGVLLERPGVPSVRGDSAERLLESTLGWRLPVSRLADWVEGRIDPSRVLEADEQGRPRLARAGDWQLRFIEYEQRRPVRLRLEQAAGYRVELLVRRWQVVGDSALP